MSYTSKGEKNNRTIIVNKLSDPPEFPLPSFPIAPPIFNPYVPQTSVESSRSQLIRVLHSANVASFLNDEVHL